MSDAAASQPTPLQGPSRGRARSHSLSAALPPLSTSPPSSSLLNSSEFKNAFASHQRSVSSSGRPGAIPIAPPAAAPASSSSSSAFSSGPFSPTAPLPLSHSPTSTASSSESDRLPTPSSSPTFAFPLGLNARPRSLKGPEEAIQEDDAEEAMFANGARWGFAQAPTIVIPQRRASLGPGTLTSPLGRVNSAGATFGGGGGGGSSGATGAGGGSKAEGWGIFRRLSQSSNFAGRPHPPSPPPTTLPSAPLASPTVASSQHDSFATAVNPPSATTTTPATERGRRASASGPRPKRKISPMGERMLTGGFHH